MDEEKIHKLEIQITKIEGKVDHIMSRIDNGLSDTIHKIWEKIDQDIMPAIYDSRFWIDKLKQGFFWVTVIAVGGGLVRLFMEWIHNI